MIWKKPRHCVTPQYPCRQRDNGHQAGDLPTSCDHRVQREQVTFIAKPLEMGGGFLSGDSSSIRSGRWFRPRRLALSVFIMLIASKLAGGQSPCIPPWIADFYGHHRIVSNITYKKIGSRELKLDVYQRTDVRGPAPTVFYVHGGAWVHGSPVSDLDMMLPWMALGWSLVSIEYRLSGEAPAPAAIVDCRAALRWVASNASTYQFDLKRLIICGTSAGGELALMTALAPASAELDGEAMNVPLPQAIALVNFSPIIDVREFLQGPPHKIVSEWVGDGPDGEEMARRVSPIHYVRPGLPPVFTVFGDKDPSYSQAVRFHQALAAAGVVNQLYTVPGGGHGGYSHEQSIGLFNGLCAFLEQHHLSAGK